MRNGKPLISVLMGVRYRRENLALLERSVRSILNQSCTDFELLICEQGSTDAARQRLRQFVQEDDRIRLLDGTGAASLAAKLNRCIRAAKGEYFARQDDDDFSDATRFELQLDYLRLHPEIAFVGSTARLEQNGTLVGLRRLPMLPQVKDFLFVQPFLHPTLMFRANVFENGMRYCEDDRCDGCEDYDLLLRLYEHGLKGSNLQNPCFTYTIPPRGKSNRTWKLRCNEVRTRWVRFKSLRLLPGAAPYVVKPLAVGLVPEFFRQRLKEKRCESSRKQRRE